MKKTTGKVLSLVLSLALVLTSFPAMLASASTKSATGIVDDTDKDDIYMVNGGSKEEERESTELNDWIEEKVQTSTRDDVDDVKVYAISHVSGDRLVSLHLKNDDDDAYLKLKGKDVKGTEVISVLYKGTYTDDDDNEYTIKARKNFTVHVYDENTPVFGKVKDSNRVESSVPGHAGAKDPAGKGFDDFETMAKTMNTHTYVGMYLAQRADKTSAMATYKPIYVTTNKNGIDGSNDGNKVVINNDTTWGQIKDSAYYLEISDGKSDVNFTNDEKSDGLVNEKDVKKSEAKLVALNTDTNPFVVISGKDEEKDKDGNGTGVYKKDASTTNVTFTLKKLKESSGDVSNDSSDKYTLKTKVEKKIDVAQAVKNAHKDLNTTAAGGFSILKNDGKARLIGITDYSDKDENDRNLKDVDVTDCELVFPEETASVGIGDDDDSVNIKKISGTVGNLSIAEKGNVGSIDIDGGTVEVNGKVGDITTDDDTDTNLANNGSVTVKSQGKTGNIDTTDADGSGEGDVTISGGTTGDIETKGSIDIDGDDSDDAINTGVITAVDADIYSDESKVTIGGLKAKDDDGTLDLQGDDLNIKSIDLDSRDTDLQIGDDDEDDKAFTGTLPEIKNATNATVKTENEDTEATVTGDLDVDTLDLDSGTKLTFSGKVTADTIEGDGTITVPAGKLYVSGSVSSTRLKLSGSNLAVGTVAFTAKADEVDDDDFDCYGFTLAKTEGKTTDTFKIASLSFAGVQINKTSSEIAKGYSETFTASAYPTGTKLPDGYSIDWELDGGSDDVFSMTTTANTATVKVSSIDDTFASENKTTLTATLLDADGYEVDEDDYGKGTCNITAVATPAVTHKSDTTSNFKLAQGASYQFKITSSDGSEPVFGVGSGSLAVSKVGKSGNAYFYKVTAVGKVGDQVGVYLDKARLLVVTISAPNIKLDTGSKLNVAKGKTYQFKATSTTPVTATTGNGSVFQIVKTTRSGNNTFVMVKAVGSKGQCAGIYFNGVRRTIATVV